MLRQRPLHPASEPAKVETVMSTGLAAGISPEAALSSENQVIPGSQWMRTERSLMGVPQVFRPSIPWSLGEPNWPTSPWLRYLDRFSSIFPPPLPQTGSILLVLLTLTVDILLTNTTV